MMKPTLGLAIILVYSLTGCAKKTPSAPNMPPPILNPKPKPDRFVPSGKIEQWTAKDDKRNLFHIVEIGPKGEFTYRIERTVFAPDFQMNPETKKWEPQKSGTSYYLIEESTEGSTDCPKPDSCLSVTGLAQAKIVLSLFETQAFKIDGLECNRVPEVTKPHSGEHGSFDETSLVFKAKDATADFLLSFAPFGLKGYLVRVEPKDKSAEFVAYTVKPFGEDTVGSVRIDKLNEAPLDRIAIGRPVLFQLYKLISDKLVPTGAPQEIVLPARR